MKLAAKYFDELTTKELYEILRVRAEIFVVEQNCVYQDLDGTDYRSLHVFYEEEILRCAKNAGFVLKEKFGDGEAKQREYYIFERKYEDE